MKRKILCLSSFAACLPLLILPYVHHKQSEWDSLTKYVPELRTSSVQIIELFQIWSNEAFRFRKKIENQENIFELLDIMDSFSIKRTDYTKGDVPYPAGGTLFIRLDFDTVETLEINICNFDI